VLKKRRSGAEAVAASLLPVEAILVELTLYEVRKQKIMQAERRSMEGMHAGPALRYRPSFQFQCWRDPSVNLTVLPFRIVQFLLPGRSRASSTVHSNPAFRSSYAATIPAIPASRGCAPY
jgi:hypothetical protein